MNSIKGIDSSNLKLALDFVWTVFLDYKDDDCLTIGIEAFKKHINYDNNLELITTNRLYFYGYYVENELVGVISVRDSNHICMLYVDSQFQHKSIASQLLQTVVETVKLDDSIKKITVNSSHYAIGFYHKQGFVDTDVEKVIDEIRFTPMCLNL